MAKYHQNKEISAAIEHAIAAGWTYTKGKNYGALWCPNACGCRMSIWSTPTNPQDHAKRIRKTVDRCPTGEVSPRLRAEAGQPEEAEPTDESNEGEAES